MRASNEVGRSSFAPGGAPTCHQVAIVTDSVSQLSIRLAQDLGITIVPMKLILSGREYRDGIDITPAELYCSMREQKVLPQTSSPSVGDYQSVFTQLLHDGAEAIVCLTPSSRLTMAFGAATMAARLVQAEFPGKRVITIDTRTAACAQGFVVMQTARVAMQGHSLEQVVATAREACQRVGLIAAVDTLEYLARGGRVGAAANLLGSLLQVKPLLVIQNDGTAACIARRRTKRAALAYMVAYVVARMNGHRPLQLAVMQADASQEAIELQRLAAQSWPTVEIPITDFTPVMGGHTGPGLIGLAFHYE